MFAFRFLKSVLAFYFHWGYCFWHTIFLVQTHLKRTARSPRNVSQPCFLEPQSFPSWCFDHTYRRFALLFFISLLLNELKVLDLAWSLVISRFDLFIQCLLEQCAVLCAIFESWKYFFHIFNFLVHRMQLVNQSYNSVLNYLLFYPYLLTYVFPCCRSCRLFFFVEWTWICYVQINRFGVIYMRCFYNCQAAS